MVVEIALLGEVSVRVGGQRVDLGPARQWRVLAALAVDTGRLVPADRLVGGCGVRTRPGRDLIMVPPP